MINYDWLTKFANKGRMINLFKSKGLTIDILASDDQGFNWQEINLSSLPEQGNYVVDFNFYHKHGYLIATHYGGYSYFLLESKDNGDNWKLLGKYLEEPILAIDGYHSYPKSVLNFKGEAVVIGQISSHGQEKVFGFIHQEKKSQSLRRV